MQIIRCVDSRGLCICVHICKRKYIVFNDRWVHCFHKHLFITWSKASHLVKYIWVPDFLADWSTLSNPTSTLIIRMVFKHQIVPVSPHSQPWLIPSAHWFPLQVPKKPASQLLKYKLPCVSTDADGWICCTWFSIHHGWILPANTSITKSARRPRRATGETGDWHCSGDYFLRPDNRETCKNLHKSNSKSSAQQCSYINGCKKEAQFSHLSWLFWLFGLYKQAVMLHAWIPETQHCPCHVGWWWSQPDIHWNKQRCTVNVFWVLGHTVGLWAEPFWRNIWVWAFAWESGMFRDFSSDLTHCNFQAAHLVWKLVVYVKVSTLDWVLQFTHWQ